LLTLTARLLLSAPLFIPGPFWVWDYLHKLSFTWYCGFTYLFMAQLFLFDQRQVHRVVTGMMAAAPLWLLLLLVMAAGDYRLYRWWMGLIVVVCVCALGHRHQPAADGGGRRCHADHRRARLPGGADGAAGRSRRSLDDAGQHGADVHHGLGAHAPHHRSV
jgi:hypothetical protein